MTGLPSGNVTTYFKIVDSLISLSLTEYRRHSMCAFCPFGISISTIFKCCRAFYGRYHCLRGRRSVDCDCGSQTVPRTLSAIGGRGISRSNRDRRVSYWNAFAPDFSEDVTGNALPLLAMESHPELLVLLAHDSTRASPRLLQSSTRLADPRVLLLLHQRQDVNNLLFGPSFRRIDSIQLQSDFMSTYLLRTL